MEAFNLHVPQYKDIDLLYSIIKQNPDFLHASDHKLFVETPLHFAAGEGRTELALEIQRLMPSFGMKLNADGFSPLHLALRRGRTETVRAMIRLNSELIAVQGREGITPLHYAAEIDDVDMLAEFLVWCPDSIEKLTFREETVVHVAMKCRKLAAVKVLVGWMRRNGKTRVLGWKDLMGNTALHLAASTNEPQVMKALFKVGLGRGYSKVNAKNCGGLTALDIVMQLPSHEDNERALSVLRRRGAKAGSSITPTTLADYLSSNTPFANFVGIFSKYTDTAIPAEVRSTILVVATLIATATYQGVLRPPDNLIHPTTTNNNNHNHTIITKIGSEVYAFDFMVPNSIALAASLVIMFLLLPCRAYNVLLHFSLGCMMFITYLMVESTASLQPDLKVVAYIAIFALPVIFFGLILLKLASASHQSIMDSARRIL